MKWNEFWNLNSNKIKMFIIMTNKEFTDSFVKQIPNQVSDTEIISSKR
jgi:hypothetical protein